MIKGVLFDLDGTLTRMNIDLSKVRKRLNIKEGPILEYLNNLKPEERDRGYRLLEEVEDKAVRSARLQKGARRLLDFLSEKGIKKGIVTRNSRSSVNIILKRYSLSFDVILTREDAPVKPSGEPLLLAGRLLNEKPSELIFIGDYKFDILSGQAAGVRTILLVNESSRKFVPLADCAVNSLLDIRDIIENER